MCEGSGVFVVVHKDHESSGKDQGSLGKVRKDFGKYHDSSCKVYESFGKCVRDVRTHVPRDVRVCVPQDVQVPPEARAQPEAGVPPEVPAQPGTSVPQGARLRVTRVPAQVPKARAPRACQAAVLAEQKSCARM